MERDALGVKAASRRARWFRGSLAGMVTVLLMSVSFPSGAANPADREYADAVHAFKIGRTSEAFGQFTALADRGDVDSARIALFLYSYGPALYAKHWDATPPQLAYWTSLVRNSGASGRAMDEFQPAALGVRAPGRHQRSAVTTVSAAR